jgi:hypothetical protein
MMVGHALRSLGGMIAGNFLWEAATTHAWGVAAEHSYFQAAAVLVVLWNCRRLRTLDCRSNKETTL